MAAIVYWVFEAHPHLEPRLRWAGSKGGSPPAWGQSPVLISPGAEEEASMKSSGVRPLPGGDLTGARQPEESGR